MLRREKSLKEVLKNIKKKGKLTVSQKIILDDSRAKFPRKKSKKLRFGKFQQKPLNLFKLPSKRKSKRNIRKKSYRRLRPFHKPRRHLSIRKLKLRVSKVFKVSKPKIGTLFVRCKRRNSFLTLTRRVKNKAIDKYGKPTKKPQFRVAHVVSIGNLREFKGRAKSSPVAIKALARFMIKHTLRKRFHILNIIFLTEMKRLYFPIVKACAKRGIVLRLLKRNILRPHGYVRQAKEKRK